MVILGLGSNLGDRLSFLKQAVQRLKTNLEWFELHAISPLYESPALLLPGAPDEWNRPFLNLAVLGHSPLTSQNLLKQIKALEVELGRQSRGRWGPREIDIDILARDGEVLSTHELTLPHPGLAERPFAYLPARDLSPNWIFPEGSPHSGISLANHSARCEQLSTRRSHETWPELMGILNITPDSFSDGGVHLSPDFALKTARAWCQEGVRILDLGAESTRPGAEWVDPKEEQRRLAPFLEAIGEDPLLKDQHAIISLDSRNPETVRWALKRGVHWMNDVSGLTDPQMIQLAADSGSPAVFMHSLNVPARKDVVLPENCDAVEELLKWAHQRILELLKQGIKRDQLVFDPGLGFGKTPAQSWEILRQIKRFHTLGVKILVGHSRKSFQSTLGNRPAIERDLETTILSVDLAQKGVDYLRVHDPILNARALRAWTQANGVIRCRD